MPQLLVFLSNNGKCNETLTITGDGEQRRDFTHVYDICDGLICLSKDTHRGEVYNLGTGTNYSINEIAAMFSDTILHIFQHVPGEARITLADISSYYNNSDISS
jgi:UDP-glucose 4-epimerase